MLSFIMFSEPDQVRAVIAPLVELKPSNSLLPWQIEKSF